MKKIYAAMIAFVFTAALLVFGGCVGLGESHKHTLVFVEGVPATCQKSGIKQHYKCTSCGEYYEKSDGKRQIYILEIFARSHTANGTETVAEATCERAGKTRESCQWCGVEISVKDIPALGHNYGEWQETPASCLNDGANVRTCTRCGETESESIPAHGHLVESWKMTKPAGCEEEGAREGACVYCGETQQGTLEASGHKETKQKEVKATCTEDGKTAGTYCSRCDVILSGCESIPATGHIWVSGDREPSCTFGGRTGYVYCSGCYEVQSEGVVGEPLGHLWETKREYVAPTCTQTGSALLERCTRELCWQERGGAEIPALGHTTVTDEAVPFTCTRDGKTEGSHCETCGEVFVAQNVLPARHTLVYASLSEEEHVATCTVCNDVQTEAHAFDGESGLCVCGRHTPSEGLQFERVTSETGDYLRVVGMGSCTGGRIAVPSTYNGLPVKEIGAHAFNSSVTDLTLPDTIEKFSRYAFGECGSTEKIKVNLWLDSLDFWYYVKITKDGCTESSHDQTDYGYDNFSEKTLYVAGQKVTKLVVPFGVTQIKAHTFEGMPIEELEFSEILTAIGDGAFNGCALKTLDIPAAIVSVGEYAFSRNAALRSLTLNEGLEVLGDGAFSHCTSFVNGEGARVYLPESVTDLGYDLFDGSNLQYLTIPDITGRTIFNVYGEDMPYGLEIQAGGTLSEDTFQDCDYLVEIKLLEGVRIVPYRAFFSCGMLMRVSLPKTLNYIGSEAFRACSDLSSFGIAGTNTWNVYSSGGVLMYTYKHPHLTPVASYAVSMSAVKCLTSEETWGCNWQKKAA